MPTFPPPVIPELDVCVVEPPLPLELSKAGALASINLTLGQLLDPKIQSIHVL